MIKGIQRGFNLVRNPSNDKKPVTEKPGQRDNEENEDPKKDVNSKPESEKDSPPVEDDDYQLNDELKKKTKSEQKPGTEFLPVALKDHSPSASILSPLEIGE